MNFIARALAAFALLACGLAQAADPAASDAQAKAQYEAEKARCMNGSTGQTQASCLKSAGAAYDSAKAGRLNDPSTAYRQNALTRCASLPASDKPDCEARVAAGVSGSDVNAGGSIQESRTVVTPSSVEATTTVK